MKKLSEYRDEEALDLLADILNPVVEIMQDEQVQECFKKDSGKTIAQIVTLIIKSHKRAVMDILAALEGVDPSEYHCDIFTLPVRALEIANDPDLRSFFVSQGQTNLQSISGSATETSEEGESDTF